MKKLGKKLIALFAVAVMIVTTMTGCSKEFNNKATAIEVNGVKISAGVANFYMRYQQKEMETMFAQMGGGSNIWLQDMGNGSTYESLVKDKDVETLIELNILKEHAAEYDVKLTDDEKTAIDKAANEFVKANKESERDKISGELEIVKETLELITISEKVKAAIRSTTSVEISDEEAAQKKLAYVLLPKQVTDEYGTATKLSDTEIEQAKTNATTILENSKASGTLTGIDGVEVKEIAFDKKSTAIAEEAIAAADALGEGEFSEVIETEEGFYVIQLKSLFDEEATEQKKAVMLNEKKDEHYQEVYDAWREKAKVNIVQKVIDKIKLSALEIVAPTVG